MFRAYYESANFSFEAYDTTELGARVALVKGLDLHAKQYNCRSDWFDKDSIQSYAIATGVCLRDRETIVVNQPRRK